MIRETVIDIPTPSAAQLTYNITGGPFRLVAVAFFWTDAGGALNKVGSAVVTDSQGNLLFRGSGPTSIAAMNVFATIGIGVSHGIGAATTMASSVVSGPLPDVWIDHDSILTIQILDAEAATFITRAVAYIERHD